MILLRAAFAIVLTLMAQLLTAKFAPMLSRVVDWTLLPVVWWGIAGSQRSAMFVGCASGLLHDAWFRVAVFGIGGFKRTLLGWVLGGLGSRFDFNHGVGRFGVGFSVTLIDGLLDLGLRRMLDLKHAAPALELVTRSLCTAIVCVVVFSLIDRFSHNDGSNGRFR